MLIVFCTILVRAKSFLVRDGKRVKSNSYHELTINARSHKNIYCLKTCNNHILQCSSTFNCIMEAKVLPSIIIIWIHKMKKMNNLREHVFLMNKNQHKFTPQYQSSSLISRWSCILFEDRHVIKRDYEQRSSDLYNFFLFSVDLTISSTL